MDKLIVSETASQSLKVDKLAIKIDLTSLDLSYSIARENLLKSIDYLSKLVEEIGVKSSLNDYNISQEYKYDNRMNKKNFLGYKFIASYEVEFNIDNDKIDKFIKEISNISIEKALTFKLYASIPDSLESELIKKAYQKCLVKAKLLAKVSKSKIVDIESIDDDKSSPSAKKVLAYSRSFADSNLSFCNEDSLYDPVDFSKKEVNYSKTVNVIYNIGKI